MKPLLNAATETLITLTHNNEKYEKIYSSYPKYMKQKAKQKECLCIFENFVIIQMCKEKALEAKTL